MRISVLLLPFYSLDSDNSREYLEKKDKGRSRFDLATLGYRNEREPSFQGTKEIKAHSAVIPFFLRNTINQ